MNAPDLAASWWALAGRGLADGSLALLVLLALWWPLRRRLPPRVVCALFLLPLLKVALPVALPAPAWLSPLSLLDPWPADPAPLVQLALLDSVEVAAAPSPVTATAPAPAAWLGAREVLCAGWALGVLLLGARFLRAQVRTRRAVRRARPIDPATLPFDLHALRARAGVFRRVRWLVSDHVATPAAGGVLSPYVLLPEGFAHRLPARQLAFVLLHELAHIRRHDVAVALLQRGVQILWFFHPAVWLANWLIDQHRELACDQDALARSRASRRECGEAFLSVAAWVHGRALEPTATLAMFESKSVLRRRLMQILTDVPAPSRLLTAAYLVLAAAITLPSAKAADDASFDLVTQQQDDGQRAEIEQLRRQIAELKKQQAQLEKQLARSRASGAEGDESDRKKVAGRRADRVVEMQAEAEAEDDDDTPKRQTRVLGKGAQAYVVEGGKLRRLPGGDGEPVLLHGVEVGDGDVRVFVGSDGKWVRAKAGDGEDDAADGAGRAVRVLRVGDGKTVRVALPKAIELSLTDEARGRIEARLQDARKLPKALRVDGVPGAFTLELDTEADEAGKVTPRLKVLRRADDDDGEGEECEVEVRADSKATPGGIVIRKGLPTLQVRKSKKAVI